ncbi:uncharacterized protein LOC111298303 [Durio zibethinus]|uniref:Uncharacterized protein LOC111298303 n=1 Tax=Durio zibethinus TaxID=66656 RepID=A0A6P5Z8J7_DURZI|nr:uncharacterized protein LOC111298303 [Durio zibethinus]
MADFKRGDGEDFSATQDNVERIDTAKKYGGLVPKKKPLISKDHERAFFDSADWELCKQAAGGVNQESAQAIETLRPKLQRTPHQQLPPRRPTCTSHRDNTARAVEFIRGGLRRREEYVCNIFMVMKFDTLQWALDLISIF